MNIKKELEKMQKELDEMRRKAIDLSSRLDKAWWDVRYIWIEELD